MANGLRSSGVAAGEAWGLLARNRAERAELVLGNVRTGSRYVPLNWHLTASADLAAFAAERLAPFKRPHSIDVIDALPREAHGKLKKRLLRDPYWTDVRNASRDMSDEET